MRIGLRILKPQTVEWLRRQLQRGEFTRATLGAGYASTVVTELRIGQVELLHPNIHGRVILMGRIAGWQPSMRRPLPGNEVL